MRRMASRTDSESNVGVTEHLTKLLEHMEKQVVFRFGVHKNDDGTVHTAYEFGEETPGSEMYAGASYGIGDSLEEALAMNIREMRL